MVLGWWRARASVGLGLVVGKVGGCLCWCCIVLVVDMVRLGWWMLMLVLYSSSGGQGKVGMVDAYVGAV